MAQDAQQFFNSIPFTTYYILILIFSLTVLATFGIATPLHYYFSTNLIFRHFQLWRLMTSIFFLGPFGFNFIISFLIFLQYSKETEEDVCNGNAADYIWCLCIGSFVMFIVGGWLLGIPFLGSCLLMYLVYIKCNMTPEANLTLMFVPIQVKAVYFPWALLLLHVAMGQSPLVDLVGIFAGHVYYYLHYLYPKMYQKQILWTPHFLYKIFPLQAVGGGRVTGYAQSGVQSTGGATGPRVQNPFRSGAHNWGGGRRLRD